MKISLQVLIAAGAVWIVSELLELIMGGRTLAVLWITALFHLLMVGGIWGAYRGQAGPRSRVSLVAAAMASVGYLILIYPPLAVSQSATLTIGEYIRGSPFFTIGANLAVFGVIAFGIAVWRTRAYPTWIAIALIACPAVFTAVMLSEGPGLLAIAANIIQSIALIGMGREGLRRIPPVPALTAA